MVVGCVRNPLGSFVQLIVSHSRDLEAKSPWCASKELKCEALASVMADVGNRGRFSSRCA